MKPIEIRLFRHLLVSIHFRKNLCWWEVSIWMGMHTKRFRDWRRKIKKIKGNK